MNRAFALSSLCLALAMSANASPPPPLPWITSNFSVQLNSTAIDFRMDCPAGKLTRLSAMQGQKVVHLPLGRLKEWAFVGSCSGVATSSDLETEGSSVVTRIVLVVKFSQEYFTEELRITFDPNRFEFTEAMWLLTYPEENSQVRRVQLQ
jgi:hypothetical protein